MLMGGFALISMEDGLGFTWFNFLGFLDILKKLDDLPSSVINDLNIREFTIHTEVNLTYTSEYQANYIFNITPDFFLQKIHFKNIGKEVTSSAEKYWSAQRI